MGRQSVLRILGFFRRRWYFVPPLLILVLFLVLKLYSRSAAFIFNTAMEQQDMLRGTITAEEIVANINGHVYFEHLEWKDPKGNTILLVPEGDFRVRVLDVLMGQYKSTTIQEMNLKDVALSVWLQDDMSWDLVPQSKMMERVPKKPDPESEWARTVSLTGKTEEELAEIAERKRRLGERRRKEQQQKIEEGWVNFNLEGKHIKTKLNLENARMEIFYKQRHYLFNDVNFDLDVDTEEKMDLDLSAGRFGGTMLGYGMRLRGNLDFTEAVPETNFALIFQNIDLSSLGMGMNLHDPVALLVYMDGPISHPIGRGSLRIDQLRIPNLNFSNVTGKVHYDDGIVRFTDVDADVYGGHLKATGQYDIDTRYYFIEGHGEHLKTGIALPKDDLKCEVELDIKVDSKGSPKNTTYSGVFTSGKGLYRWLPFDSIKGQFKSSFRNLQFYDISIDMGGLLLTTDALSVVDGKLALHPIQIWDVDGSPFMYYDPEHKKLVKN